MSIDGGSGPDDPGPDDWGAESWNAGDTGGAGGGAAGGDPDEGGSVRSRPRQQSRRSGGDWVLLGLRGVGQTLITLGLVILLFVVYEVWITNIFAAEKQSAVHKTLIQEWQQGDDPLVATASPSQAALPGSTSIAIPSGVGIANIYMPRLGDDYHFTIVEGTNDGDLEKGPGHYPGTALPGQIGDFAVAGHRVGKGEPFLNLDHLKPGDAVVIETEKSWFVYRVLGDTATGDLSSAGVEGVVGREIVSPSDVQVILPVPDHPGVTPTKALLTLTTCEPKFTATSRMIVHASLERTVLRSGDLLPRELTGGTL